MPTPKTSPSCNTTPTPSATCSPPRPPPSRTDPASCCLLDNPLPSQLGDQVVTKPLCDRGRPDPQGLLRAFESILEPPQQPQNPRLVRPRLRAFRLHPDCPVVDRVRLFVSFGPGENVGFPDVGIRDFFRIHGNPPTSQDTKPPMASLTGSRSAGR